MTHTEWIVSLDDDLKDHDEMFVGNVRDGEMLTRCKDCKHMSNETDQRDGSDVFICNFNRWRRMEGKRRDDFYCADGERKDNDRNT